MTIFRSDISSGTHHACLVNSRGAVRCWGWGVNGRNGNGTTTSSVASVQVTGLTTGVAQVAVSASSACARLTSRQVRCWGLGSGGQMGNSTSTSTNSSPVTTVFQGSALAGVATIAAGKDHFCATVAPRGEVRCWGDNANGELGDQTTTRRVSAVEVYGLSGVSKLALGATHSCALSDRGEVYCWGSNRHGEAGRDSATVQTRPNHLRYLGSENVDIAAGRNFTCVLNRRGTVRCFGDTTYVGATREGEELD